MALGRRKFLAGGATLGAAGVFGPVLLAGRTASAAEVDLDVKSYLRRLSEPPKTGPLSEASMRAKATVLARQTGRATAVGALATPSYCYPDLVGPLVGGGTVDIAQTRALYSDLPDGERLAMFLNDLFNADFLQPGPPPTPDELAVLDTWVPPRQGHHRTINLSGRYEEAELMISLPSKFTVEERAALVTHAIFAAIRPATTLTGSANAGPLLRGVLETAAGGMEALVRPWPGMHPAAPTTLTALLRRGHVLVAVERGQMIFDSPDPHQASVLTGVK